MAVHKLTMCECAVCKCTRYNIPCWAWSFFFIRARRRAMIIAFRLSAHMRWASHNRKAIDTLYNPTPQGMLLYRVLLPHPIINTFINEPLYAYTYVCIRLNQTEQFFIAYVWRLKCHSNAIVCLNAHAIHIKQLVLGKPLSLQCKFIA